MTDMPIRRLSLPVSGLALTWLVIRIPGEYAYASVWLMPTLAAFFAFATWFAFACRGMDPWMASAAKPLDYDQQRYGCGCMDAAFDHVGVICIIAGVLSALIQEIYSPNHCSWELPLATGIGILIGTRVLGKLSV